MRNNNNNINLTYFQMNIRKRRYIIVYFIKKLEFIIN